MSSYNEREQVNIRKYKTAAEGEDHNPADYTELKMPNKLPENPKWGDKLNPEWASWQEGQQATLKWMIEWGDRLCAEHCNYATSRRQCDKCWTELKALVKE